MTAQDDWDATFIPGTSVLANKLGITDPDALAAAEYTITANREAMIADGRIPIDRTYDAEHLHTATIDRRRPHLHAGDGRPTRNAQHA